jgi:16S rRNA (guanine527-N7)-methyltransferase
LTPQQLAQLSGYLDLMLEANQTMNLTRISDRAAAEVGHVGDALTVLPFLPKIPHTLIDVGSGGGVPGIPLAISRPDIRVTLLESTKKKAAFLSRAVDELALSNVQVVSDRAELVSRGKLRASFDVAIARAVGSMAQLAEWCLPLVQPGGKLLAMKGAKITEELPAAVKIIRRLGGSAAVVHPVSLPGADHHVIVEIIKKKEGRNQ